MQTLQQLVTGKLKGVKKLKLSCGLTEFPTEIFDLSASLEYLDLSGNLLNSLPEDIGKLKNLKIIFCSENNFTELPSVLSQCKTLDIIGFKSNKISSVAENALPLSVRWLILTNNCLQTLPASIGNCSKIQKLMLAGNQLKFLPPEMAKLKRLELLRISANALESLPSWIFSFPRLSWLAFAGNPFNKNGIEKSKFADVTWSDLHMEQLLGEGASGQIYKATWQKPDDKKLEVAVKIFKGELTSDGSPIDEMNACMGAGKQENIVQVLGRVKNHPQQKLGLILELIPPRFKNLGGPPDFITCTRDTYPEGTSFSIDALFKIAQGIAEACAHLHSRGILHGDLYAHNILINELSHPLIGDFGAATFYEKEDIILSNLIEKLEVRAFGCLLDDLINHLNIADKEIVAVNAIIDLRDTCMQEDLKSRPNFKSICSLLSTLH